MSKARFEAFSDSVFAFAITLLILGIALPAFKRPPSDRELARALLRLWPSLLAYILSFLVIGVIWQNHHALFRMVRSIDRATIYLNFSLLGVIVFIPFATSTLGAYPTMRSSTFLYGLTLTGSATAFNLLVMHLKRSGSFSENVSALMVRQTIVAYRLGLATYTVAMLVSLLEPVLSFALYLLVAAYFCLPHGLDSNPGDKPAHE